MIHRVFSLFVLVGSLAIFLPWALFVLVVALVLAFALVTLGFVFVQALIVGIASIDEPNSLFGWLGYAFCVLLAWAFTLSVWSDFFGIARWFARDPGDSHGSARFASKAERKALQQGTGLLIGHPARAHAGQRGRRRADRPRRQPPLRQGRP